MRSADADDLLNMGAARLTRSPLSQLLQGAHDLRKRPVHWKFSAVAQSRRFVPPLDRFRSSPSCGHRDHHFRKGHEPKGSRWANRVRFSIV